MFSFYLKLEKILAYSKVPLSRGEGGGGETSKWRNLSRKKPPIANLLSGESYCSELYEAEVAQGPSLERTRP